MDSTPLFYHIKTYLLLLTTQKADDVTGYNYDYMLLWVTKLIVRLIDYSVKNITISKAKVFRKKNYFQQWSLITVR